MQSTANTDTLLDRYQKESSKEKPQFWNFRYDLQELLKVKYNPSENSLKEVVQKKLDEYEKYFDWEESYAVNFNQTAYVGYTPSGTIECDDLDELNTILRDPEDFKYDDRIEEGNLQYCTQELEISFEEREFEDFSVSVHDLVVKPEFDLPPSRRELELTVKNIFYHNLSEHQIKILKRSDKDLVSELIDQVKRTCN